MSDIKYAVETFSTRTLIAGYHEILGQRPDPVEEKALHRTWRSVVAVYRAEIVDRNPEEFADLVEKVRAGINATP